MTDQVMRVARAAAERLAGAYGPGLPAEVEAALHRPDPDQPPERFLDPVALGALIVSAATLAWTVYRDLRTRTPAPSPEVVERTVRMELRDTGAVGAADRDRIIEVVVAETTRVATAEVGESDS